MLCAVWRGVLSCRVVLVRVRRHTRRRLGMYPQVHRVVLLSFLSFRCRCRSCSCSTQHKTHSHTRHKHIHIRSFKSTHHAVVKISGGVACWHFTFWSSIKMSENQRQRPILKGKNAQHRSAGGLEQSHEAHLECWLGADARC